MLSGVRPPEIFCRDLSLVERSGLITCQLWPPLVVRCTCWLVTNSVFVSCGEIRTGNVHWKRYLSDSAGQPPVLCGQTSTLRNVAVPHVELHDDAAARAGAGRARPDDVRVLRIGRREPALATTDRVPVAARDAATIQRIARPARRGSVLAVPHDVVRNRVVHRDVVHLRDRQMHAMPGLAAIDRDRQAPGRSRRSCDSRSSGRSRGRGGRRRGCAVRPGSGRCGRRRWSSANDAVRKYASSGSSVDTRHWL